MYRTQIQRKWFQSALIVVLAAFAVFGFSAAGASPVSADELLCVLPSWANGDFHIPQEALNASCALPSTTSEGNVAFSTAAAETACVLPSWANGDFHIPQEALDSYCALPSTTSEAGNGSFDPNSWEYTLEMEDIAMGEGPTVTVVPPTSFDPNSWEYTLEVEDIAMGEGQW